MANSDKVLGQFMQEIGEEKVDTSRKLRVGIIGTGWIAESHIESYKQHARRGNRRGGRPDPRQGGERS